MKAFEPSIARRRRRRAEGAYASLRQSVDQTGYERILGPDDDEIDALVARETDNGVDIGCLDGDTGRIGGDSGVARGTIQRVAERRSGNGPAQGMLPSARADDKDAHGSIPRRISTCRAVLYHPGA